MQATQIASKRVGALTEETEDLSDVEAGEVAADFGTRFTGSFGEFLVAEQVLDRHQLLRALQMQDRTRARLGDCIAALGFAPRNAIERLFERFAGYR